MENLLNIFHLSGKVAIVTGGAEILGGSIAMFLGKASAKVAVCDITDFSNIIKDFKKEGIGVAGYYIDVLDRKQIISCHNMVINDFGKIDIIVNAAEGNLKDATTLDELSFFDLKLDAPQRVIALNLFGGAILPAQIFGKTIAENKEGGSIINKMKHTKLEIMQPSLHFQAREDVCLLS